MSVWEKDPIGEGDLAYWFTQTNGRSDTSVSFRNKVLAVLREERTQQLLQDLKREEQTPLTAYEALSEEHRALEKDYDGLQMEVRQERVTIDNLESELHSMESELRSSESTREILAEIADSVRAENVDLCRENAALRAQLHLTSLYHTGVAKEP
jgi:chromosome segregation ATPase